MVSQALVGAISVITNLRMELFEALVSGEAATERRVRAGLNRGTPRGRRVPGNDAATGHPVTI